MRRKQRYFDKYKENADEPLLVLSENLISYYQGNADFFRFLRDERRAVEYLLSKNVKAQEIFERMFPKTRNGFYNKSGGAFALDTAAKLYPLVMGRYASSVFRLTAWLKEDVSPELLQCALNRTMPRFPFFSVLIKKGVFWHYSDTYNGRCAVMRDADVPCTQIPLSGRRAVPFRVVYSQKRIGVEFFHALTDGTGGMIFLKTLVGEYLRLCGAQFSYGEGVLDPWEACRAEEFEDGFAAVHSDLPPGGMEERSALLIKGKISFRRSRVYHFVLDAAMLKERAKAFGVTVTAFLTSEILRASRDCSDGDGLLRVQIPVNARKFYGLQTLTNCAMFACLEMKRSEVTDDHAMYSRTDEQLKKQAGKEVTERAIVKARDLVRKLNGVPLFLKRPAARAYNAVITKRAFTQTLSNLGAVRLPEGLQERVEMFDFIIGAPFKNMGYLSAVTYQNKAVISYTTSNESEAFEECFLKYLNANGISVHVLGGRNYAD